MGKVKGGFVQVLLPVHSEVPYGKRQYFPIYDAAAECGVPIGIHFGGLTVTAPTSSGWPSLYIDEYVGMSQIFQSQVLSLIAEGVFERFPDLKVVLVESGFTWLPALMWRLDKEWKGFRREVPWVRELPSTYIRRHFRATVQPVDVPPGDIVQLRRVVDQIGSGNLLMFSSDYPHNHGLDGSRFADERPVGRSETRCSSEQRAGSLPPMIASISNGSHKVSCTPLSQAYRL